MIAAVIIGGGSLLGGRGTVVGTIAGAAIMTIIQIGCSQKGLPNWVQQIVTGGIIVARGRARSRCASSADLASSEAHVDEDSRSRDPRPAVSRRRARTTAPTRCTWIPDYSAAYVILQDRRRPRGARLHVHDRPRQRGLRRGDRRVPAAGRRPRRSTRSPPTSPAFWRALASDSQLRWLGPEKGVIHLALAAIVNAVWDLYAKRERKPVWKLLADMTPRQIVVVHRLPLHHRRADAGRGARDARAAGADEGASARRSCCATAIPPTRRRPAGWATPTTRFARLLPRGARRRLDAFQGEGRRPARRRSRGASRLVREEIGPDRKLMIDANQRWDVDEAIARVRALAQFDLLVDRGADAARTTCSGTRRSRGRSRRSASRPASTAPNRVIFKQLLQASAIDFCQIDSCRLGGVNENLAVILMAAKFGVPVCPHAGGVGLCESCSTCRCSTTSRVSGRDGRPRDRVRRSPARAFRRSGASSAAAATCAPTAPGYSSEIKAGVARPIPLPGRPVWTASGVRPEPRYVP